jgi:ribosome maturation factor RimP
LDRKLTRPEDFVRFEGHRVKVRTRLPLDNQKVFRGRLEGLGDGKIRLRLDPGQPVEIPLDVVREARLEVDWDSELHDARSR